jgi:hypothetical protein
MSHPMTLKACLTVVAALMAAGRSMAQQSPVPTDGAAARPKPPGPLPSAGCASLEKVLGSKTFFPGDPVYEFEKINFWSNTQILSPACVFRPSSAQDVSLAVSTMKKANTQFAVRGGGHMGIKGANSIDGGVLLVASNLTALQLSGDRSTVTIGPGHDWGEVYSYLAKYNLGCAGGRLSPVGVPGLLLGGGISFYGNQHGWSADTVVEYEVVLASGKIVTVSASANSDLFWALKGGSSNFGIVTSFKLRTYPSKKVLAGTYTVSGEHTSQFLAAIANYSAYNTDPRSHIVPMIIPDANAKVSASAVILFYDSATESNPACFAPFFDIPSIANSVAFKTLADFSVETGALVVPGINDIFVAGTTVGKSYSSLLKGIQLVYDGFFKALPELYAQVPYDAISLVSIDWQPIGALWAAGSQRSNPGGNALGIDVKNKGTYLCWAEVVEWRGEQYTDAVNSWVAKTTAAINAATKQAKLFDAFNYMGDAAGFQDIYNGYGAVAKNKLLGISRKYDPERVYQKLLPGGFKIGV